MTKIYEIQGRDRCQINVFYCGVKIVAEFKKVAGGLSRSQLITRDKFIQDALEHDVRFGNLFKCTKSFDEEKLTPAQAVAEEKAPQTAKNITAVRSLNDALAWFGKKGELPTTDEDVRALMEKYNVAFPNWKQEEKPKE